ncbi:MAG TPA: adenosine kinase [Hyphomicrobiales bacterium]|nr:adenosine kinase [Hyphomicrobiales bacterium]
MNHYHVYGLGNALVDTEFSVTDDFLEAEGIQKGLMTLVDETSQNILLERLVQRFGIKKRAGGGSAANTIYAVSQFGGNTYYCCKVADDEPGDFYLQELGSHNIHTNLGSGRDHGTTGKCVVMVSPDTERTMLTFLGISAELDSQALDAEALRNSDYLYMEGYLASSPSGCQAVVDARKIAEANGVKTALTLSDPAMVQFFRGAFENMIGEGVDLLFANEIEAMTWAGVESVAASIPALQQIAKVVVITQGAKGALVVDGERHIPIDPVPVKAVDANGAGDMFAGAFLYALASGHDYATAGKLASLGAATTVSHFGPRLTPAQHQEVLKAVLG